MKSSELIQMVVRVPSGFRVRGHGCVCHVPVCVHTCTFPTLRIKSFLNEKKCPGCPHLQTDWNDKVLCPR
jgi:hypothetical protein